MYEVNIFGEDNFENVVLENVFFERNFEKFIFWGSNFENVFYWGSNFKNVFCERAILKYFVRGNLNFFLRDLFFVIWESNFGIIFFGWAILISWGSNFSKKK